MSVKPHKVSGVYHFEFRLNGHKVRGSTHTKNRKEAQAFERQRRSEAEAEVKAMRAATGSLALSDIIGRYWLEVGQHHVGSVDTEADYERIIEFFGENTLLSQIDDEWVARFVAHRRGDRVQRRKDAKPEDCQPLANGTVNRSGVYRLRALFTRAKLWRFKFDHEPEWKKHLLPESEERVRELVGDEQERMEAATRDDYMPIMQFALATGFRLNECLLRWSEVDWDSRQVRKLGKRRRKVTTPITDTVRRILWPLRGDHPEMVFCYTATRTMKAKGKTPATIKGRKYPITKAGLKSSWKRLRKLAKLSDFRFHDLRHDCASKTLRATGNIKLVQKVLNHADIKTTMRYAHVLDSEVAEALEKVASARNGARTEERKTLKRVGE